MGNDAFIHIAKKKCSKEMVETLLQMMDYKKCGKVYYCGNDAEYKYFSRIRVWQCDENESEVIYWIRTQILSKMDELEKIVKSPESKR